MGDSPNPTIAYGRELHPGVRPCIRVRNVSRNRPSPLVRYPCSHFQVSSLDLKVCSEIVSHTVSYIYITIQRNCFTYSYLLVLS